MSGVRDRIGTRARTGFACLRAYSCGRRGDNGGNGGDCDGGDGGGVMDRTSFFELSARS